MTIGHAFGFIKATDGVHYVHVNWFHRNAGLVRSAGLVLGAYHFLLDHHPGAAQAHYFVEEVNKAGGFAGCVPIVDIEREADGTTPGSAQLRDFVAEFRRLVPGREMLIYTGRWYWVGILNNPAGADLGRLWHSEYDGITPIDADVAGGPELQVYGGWTDALVWQHTSSGTVPGVNGNCDRNIFYGTRDELLALAGAQPKDWFDMATKDELRAVVAEECERVIRQVIGNKPLIVAFDDVKPGDPDHWFVVPGQTRSEVTKDEAAQAVAQGTARWWDPKVSEPKRVPRATLESVPVVEPKRP